jgi:hypothetical protein
MARLDAFAGAEDLPQPLGGELLAAGFRRDVRMSGEKITRPVARRQTGREEQQREQLETTHWYSGYK